MKVNWVATITGALAVAAGTAFSTGVVPAKYAGFAAIAAALIQSFQKPVMVNQNESASGPTTTIGTSTQTK